MTHTASSASYEPAASEALLASFRNRLGEGSAFSSASASLEAAVSSVAANDSDEEYRPRSKLRRRWLHQATAAPTTPPLPMEDSPGASSGSASWQLVRSDPVNEVADSVGISGSTSSFRFMPPSSTQEAVQFPIAKAMPTFQSAASYAAYPKASASAVQASITTPTPSPLQEKPPPPARQAAFAPRNLQPPPSGVTTSRDLHHVADAKNSALFAELCERHGTFSEVLQQLRGSHHGASIKARLLSKVSDTTAARYLRSVQLFFSAFEELGGQLADIDQGLFLDAFFALSRSTEDGPLSNSQNVIKALRWYKKLLGIACLPDLYGPAFSLLSSAATQEKRESIPLPLCFLAFLERTLLSGSASLEECIWAKSFLVAISASLRFADSQRIRWSSLCVNHFTLRGICFRTKTTQRGAPFGLISFGVASSSESWGLTWLPHWIAALDQVWHSLRSRFGPQTDPDCLFFLWNEAGFSPASYSQALGKLREYLVKSGIPAGQAQQYTLHSLKIIFLSYMSQLSIPLAARFLQGHHKPPGSAQLYSRDDVWPALRAQLLLWRAVHAGFRPARPQHRGGAYRTAGPGDRLLLHSGPLWRALAWGKTTRHSCHLRQPMQTYEKPALLRRTQSGMFPLSPLVCEGRRSRSTLRTQTVKDQVRLRNQPWTNLLLRCPQHGLRHRKTA